LQPEGHYYDDLDLNIHILYDDCCVLPDPSIRVGSVLFEHENGVFVDLNRQLEPLLDELGDSPDSVYMGDRRWPRVVAAAGRALELMRQSSG
jgi:hypothetical protein